VRRPVRTPACIAGPCRLFLRRIWEPLPTQSFTRYDASPAHG